MLKLYKVRRVGSEPIGDAVIRVLKQIQADTSIYKCDIVVIIPRLLTPSRIYAEMEVTEVDLIVEWQ